MTTARDIESRLLASGGADGGYQVTFRCPEPGRHRNGDAHPSAAWHKQKQAWRCYVCNASGGMLDLAKRLGLDDGEVQYPGHKSNARPDRESEELVITATYEYEVGGKVFLKHRMEGRNSKSFRWEPKLSEHRVNVRDMPLFGRETIRTGEPVLFVEGEETAKACHRKGLAAVTVAGSAAQRDFGDSLAVLHNQDVWLWADNDEEGHELMATLNAALKPIASGIHVVAVPLPPKGDAADYFRGGGKVEAIWESDTTKPAFNVVANDRIIAKVPSEKGTVEFLFEDVLHTPRALEAEVTVKVNGFEDPYHWAGNVLNPTGRITVARELRSFYYQQADLNWTRAVNTAFHGAVSAHQSIDRSVEAFTLPDPGEPGFLVPPLIARNQPTVWYSMGGTAKTYLALIASAHVALGQAWPGYNWGDYSHDKGNVLYLDYETCSDKGETFGRRLRRVAAGFGREWVGGIRYWPGNGIPLHDQLDAIRRAIRDHNVRLLVIDSALGACGGAPEESTTVQRFFSDLGKLPPVATLIISHITKPRRDRNGEIVPEAKEFPFGSIHWHNQARATWYLEGSSIDRDTKSLTFMHKKVNDGPFEPDQRFVLTFNGWQGPVKLLSKYDYEVGTHGYSSSSPHS